MAPAAKKVPATTRAAFDVKDFVQRVSAFAGANPHLAKRAFARGAERIRKEAEGRPEQAAMIALAANLDALAKMAPTPIAPRFTGLPEDYLEPNLGLAVGDAELLEERAAIGYEDHEAEINMNLPQEDSFTDAVEQHQGAMELQKAAVQQVQVTPASAQDGVTLFGNSVVVQNNINPLGTKNVSQGSTLINAESQVVRWDGPNQETMACTITVSRGSAGATFPTALDPTRLAPSGALGNVVYRPYFHMLWGAGQGQYHEVYGDVGRGAQFTVAATHVYVNMGMDPVISSLYQNGSMQLTGSIGFFASARQSPITRTLYVDNLAAGATTTLIIPLFATSVQSIWTPSGSAFSFVVESVDNDLAPLTAPNLQLQPVVLPNHAYQLLVSNNGAGTASCSVVFGLSL